MVSSKLKQMIANNVGVKYLSNLKMVLCTLCNYHLTANLCANLGIHLKSQKHLDNVKTDLDSNHQDNFVNRDFNKAFTKALIESGIPLNVVDKKPFRQFFETYLGKILPRANTLRQIYMPKIYQDTIDAIKKRIFGQKVYIQIDETRDKQRCMIKF